MPTQQKIDYKLVDSLDIRSDDADVFFQDEQSSAQVVSQIRVTKANYLPLVSKEDLALNKKIKSIVGFFRSNAMINLSNFQVAEKLFHQLLLDGHSHKDILELLRQELDKGCCARDRLGKVFLSYKIGKRSIRLVLERSKLNGIKQYVHVEFFNSKAQLKVLTYSQEHKNRFEFIRSRTNPLIHEKHDQESINIDAMMWKSLNQGHIVFKDSSKFLDCLERNQFVLDELCSMINHKTVFNRMSKDFVDNIQIKTNNRDISFIKFTTHTRQKVEAKLTNFASSITVTL